MIKEGEETMKEEEAKTNCADPLTCGGVSMCSTPSRRRRSQLHWPSNVINLLLQDEELPRHEGLEERIDWREAMSTHSDLLSSYSHTQLAAKSVLLSLATSLQHTISFLLTLFCCV